MSKAELLRELREKTGSADLSDREFWKATQFPAGVARGIVVELLGNARTEWLLEIFALYPEAYIYWCEREAHINPTRLHQRGVGLHRVKFVNSGGDLQQPLRLALESKFYPFIVAPSRFNDIKIFQRFHLLAEKSKSTLFLLANQKFSPAWPISLQLEINFADEGYALAVQKQKHGLISEGSL